MNGSRYDWPEAHASYEKMARKQAKLNSVDRIKAAKDYHEAAHGQKAPLLQKNTTLWGKLFSIKAPTVSNLRDVLNDAAKAYVAHSADFDAILAHDAEKESIPAEKTAVQNEKPKKKEVQSQSSSRQESFMPMNYDEETTEAAAGGGGDGDGEITSMQLAAMDYETRAALKEPEKPKPRTESGSAPKRLTYEEIFKSDHDKAVLIRSDVYAGNYNFTSMPYRIADAESMLSFVNATRKECKAAKFEDNLACKELCVTGLDDVVFMNRSFAAALLHGDMEPASPFSSLCASTFAHEFIGTLLALAQPRAAKNVWSAEVFAKMLSTSIARVNKSLVEYAKKSSGAEDGSAASLAVEFGSAGLPLELTAKELYKFIELAMKDVGKFAGYNDVKRIRSIIVRGFTDSFNLQNPESIPAIAPLFLSFAEVKANLRRLLVEKDYLRGDHRVIDWEAMRKYGSFEIQPPESIEANWKRDAETYFAGSKNLRYDKPFYGVYGDDASKSEAFCDTVLALAVLQMTALEVRAAIWARLHHYGTVKFSQCMPGSLRALEYNLIMDTMDAMKPGTDDKYRVNLSRLRPVEFEVCNMSVANVWSPPGAPWIYLSSSMRIQYLIKMRTMMSLDDRDCKVSWTTCWLRRMHAVAKKEQRGAAHAYLDTKAKTYVPDITEIRSSDRAGRTCFEVYQLIEACANESHYVAYQRMPWTTAPEDPPRYVLYGKWRETQDWFANSLRKTLGDSANLSKADLRFVMDTLRNTEAANRKFCDYEHDSATFAQDIGDTELRQIHPRCPDGEQYVIEDVEDKRVQMLLTNDGVSWLDERHMQYAGVAGILELYTSCISYTAIWNTKRLLDPEFGAARAGTGLRPNQLPDVLNSQRDKRFLNEDPAEIEALFPRQARLAYYQMLGHVEELIEEGVCPICLVNLSKSDPRKGAFHQCERCAFRAQFNRRYANLYEDEALPMERISAHCADVDERGFSNEKTSLYEPAHIHVATLKCAIERGLPGIRCDLAHYYGDDPHYSSCQFVYHRAIDFIPLQMLYKYANMGETHGDDFQAQFFGNGTDRARGWWSIPQTRMLPPQMVLLHAAHSPHYVSERSDHNRIACLHHAMREKAYAAKRRENGMLTAAEMFAANVAK